MLNKGIVERGVIHCLLKLVLKSEYKEIQKRSRKNNLNPANPVTEKCRPVPTMGVTINPLTSILEDHSSNVPIICTV